LFSRKDKKIKPYVLVILDGWGMAPVWGGNAISLAETPNFKKLQKKYPFTALAASESAVGLPAGTPGNSEAGHLNIGAGKVVYQDQPIIDKEIENGSFFNNKVLLDTIQHARSYQSNIHIMGLLSKTGTHSHINHLFALLRMMKENNFNKVYIHLFTDGRDSDPMSGIEMLSEIESEIKKIDCGVIESIIGRFYSMDRDNRWDRILKAYNLLTNGKGKAYDCAGAIFTDSYSHGVTDEFIEPSFIQNKTQHFIPINNNDSVIFFNFRSDRIKELTRTFLELRTITQDATKKKLKNIYFATFSLHEEKGFGKRVFNLDIVKNPIAEILSKQSLRQYHTAETEKYAHITYFLNGGREEAFPGEDRYMVPSPKVLTYDKKPEMSVIEVTRNLVQVINKNIYDCLFVNFANADMVGHTGNLDATVRAVETIDKCLGNLINVILKQNGVALVCSDHGNAEQMVNPKTGSPDTEHTCNPVPFSIISNEDKLRSIKLRKDGKLSSVLPTMLEIMGLPFEKEEKEQSLIQGTNG
jgi:2,3-bisphosphoglycerate-independent phosphoglycerate mutase